MSSVKSILQKNYMNDIFEASDGFFLTVADDVQFTDPKDIYSPIKIDMAYKYGLGDASVPEMDEYFSKFLKYNAYDIFRELKVSKPVLKDVIQIYGNKKIINATLVMSVRLDITDYVTKNFYHAIKPQGILDILEENDSFKYVDFYIQVSFKIDGILKNFKTLGATKYKPNPIIPNGAIHYDGDMIPDSSSFTYEDMARNLREKYKITTPVNISDLLYEVGLTVDDSFTLDKNTHGLICLSDGYIKNNNKLVLVKENTILIDKDLIKNYGVGSYRFNVLHELVHFEYHDYYLALKRQLAGDQYAISDNRIPIKKAEMQANNVAGLLLVPSDELFDRMMHEYERVNFYFASNRYTLLNRIANKEAEYFNCSKTCMHQRIKAINIYTGGYDLTEIDNTYINKDEFNEIYNKNDDFREMVDNKQIVYINNQCVINDESNVNADSLTFYSDFIPAKNMVSFNRVYRNTHYNSDEFMAHITITKELFNSVINKIKGGELKASIDIVSFISKVFEEDKYDNLIVGDLGKSIKNIRESKHVGYNTLSKITGLDVKDIYKLENNLVKNPTIKTVVLICKGLNLPKVTTKRLVDKLGGFEKTIEDKAIEFIMDKNYDADNYEFYEMIQDGIRVAEMIEKENIELIKEMI